VFLGGQKKLLEARNYVLRVWEPRAPVLRSMALQAMALCDLQTRRDATRNLIPTTLKSCKTGYTGSNVPGTTQG
jgi:hypothetical protein